MPSFSSKLKIHFLGAGNMSTCIIKGLIKSGVLPHQISTSQKTLEKAQALKTSLGINAGVNNFYQALSANVLFLAVKPQVMAEAIGSLAQFANSLSSKEQPESATHKTPLVISVAAGTTFTQLNHLLSDTPTLQAATIIRTMPNTPSLIQAGITGLCTDTKADNKQKQLSEALMQSIGETVWVDSEEQLDMLTAISGCGPAYCYLFMEALTSAGEALGLDNKTALKLSKQTVLGAAKLACNSNKQLEQLRTEVTSKGGVTAAGLEQFSEDGLEQTVHNAVKAAFERARELAQPTP